MPTIEDEQRSICASVKVKFFPTPPMSKLGISENARGGLLLPVNGLRHAPTPDSNGWYIWSGEDFSADDDFFVPLHAMHIREWCPIAERFLALPPGFRFLATPDHFDVWFDEALLKID
jgi:hypothetical protein